MIKAQEVIMKGSIRGQVLRLQVREDMSDEVISIYKELGYTYLGLESNTHNSSKLGTLNMLTFTKNGARFS